MATSVHLRPQNRDLGMVMRQVDEDLAIFLGLPNADDKEINDHPALGGSYGLEPKSGNLFSSTASQEEIVPVLADVKFLNVEIGRSGHHWLVAQPDTLADMDEQDLPATKANCVAISESGQQLENGNDELITSSDSTLHQEVQDSSSTNTDNSSSVSSVTMANKRTSSTGSRKPTPTTRSSLPAKSKPSRPSTPTTRSTLPSPPFRPTIARSRPHPPIVLKPGPRSATPRCKPTALTTVTSKKLLNPKVLAEPNKKRPVSEPRGRRMNGPISCSSPKVQTRSKMTWSSSDGCEDVNPVVMGARMVNRVVSMRKLAPPPKENECVSSRDNLIGKSHQASSGFGRSMSKKSLDMAIRHMDIRRTISN